MVKKAIGDTLDYLADNLKTRAEQLRRQPVATHAATTVPAHARSAPEPDLVEPRDQPLRAVGELATGEPDDGVDIAAAQRRDQLAVAGHRGDTPLRVTRVDLRPAGTARRARGTRPA